MKKILFGACTILSCLLIFLILNHHTAYFDTTIYNVIISLQSDFMTNFFLSISSITLLFVMICILFWIFHPRKIISFFVSFHLAFPFIISNVFKLIFQRERPIGIALTFEPGYSMPSSHAMVSIVFVGFLCFLFCGRLKNRHSKIILIVLATLYISLIGMSRVYLGVHYASDVLLGFLLGILYLLLFFHLKKIKQFFQKGVE